VFEFAENPLDKELYGDAKGADDVRFLLDE